MERLQIPQLGMSGRSFDFRQMAKMRVDTVNSKAGDLPGYDCPLCRNRGYTCYLREDDTLVSRECECMSIRRCGNAAKRSGLNRLLLEKRFRDFRADTPWQQRMLEISRNYAQRPEGWLMLSGQSGCGKTHLCAAVCRSLLSAGNELRYISWRDTVVEYKALAGDYDRQQALMQPLKQVAYLYIDDLFKCGGEPSPADRNFTFELLNYRYNNRLPTVISTERTPRQLGELDGATGSRILELCGENLVCVDRDDRKNYRLRSATGH